MPVSGQDALADALFQLYRALQRDYGVIPLRVRIDLVGNVGPIRLPFPARCVYPDAAPAQKSGGASVGAEKVYPMERRILEAVAGMDEENPTAAQIMKAAGLNLSANHLRKWLSALRTNGRLGGKAGQDAYPITPKGAAAVEAS